MNDKERANERDLARLALTAVLLADQGAKTGFSAETLAAVARFMVAHGENPRAYRCLSRVFTTFA